MNIFVDADAFIAANNDSDASHKRASALIQKLKEEDVTLYTSWDVIDEVATKLSYFSTKEASLAFFDFIEKLGVKVLYPDKLRSQLAKKLFAKIKSKRVSMTDVMNMVLVEEFDLDCIFSFDKVYKNQGFVLLEDYLS